VPPGLQRSAAVTVTPVMIEIVELLRLNSSYVCRVRSKDGEGIPSLTSA
jgi:hypothetical protein